jgi:lambda-carrageenase
MNHPIKLCSGNFIISAGVLCALSLFCSCESIDSDPYFRYYDVGANIWHLEKQDDAHLVMADYNGCVSLYDTRNESGDWTFDAGSFVFDLATGDIDGDKKSETVFVTAQGELIVLNSSGEKLWSFQSKLPLYNVGIGNFRGDHNLEIVCGGIDRHVYIFDHLGNQIGKSPEVERLVHRIAVGNLNEDQYDEILVIENRTIARLMAFQVDSFQTVWRKQLKVPDELINWENPRGSFFPFSIEVSDLDGDGIGEIIMGDTFFNKQAVMVADNEANPLWLSKGLPSFQKVDGAQIEFYSTAFVRGSDIFSEIPGKELISVAGGMFRIWDKEGNLLGRRNSKLGFTDLEVDGNTLFLGSCPNGDQSIYKIVLSDEWEEVVGGMEFNGLIKEIKENTATLRKQVEEYIPEEIPEQDYNLIIGFGSMPTSRKGLEEHRKQLDWFFSKFPYDNLNPIKTLKVIEETPPLDEAGEPWNLGRWKLDGINGTMTVDEIMEKARWIEENRIPTMFYIGHSCTPFITLETAERILQVAPNYCLGFQSAEDEQIEVVPRYFEHFFKPLANLCIQYGNKLCLTKNKGIWWMSSPADPQAFDTMFADGRGKVSVAATEDSNSRTPEMNLMGRGGLWQAGLIQHNDVSIHADLFSFNRFQQWEYPRAGHPYLRLLVAHTTMGMTQVSTRIREIMPAADTAEFEPTGKESTEIFYHLLGKGIIFSPDREDALGYSPVGVVVHKPAQKWLTDAHNGHSPERWVEDKELHQAVFPHNGSLWGMTNTPDHAFQKVIFNKQRQFGYQMPPTPYGLVAFVPEFADLNDVAHVHQWWHTDGICAWKEGGPKLTGAEAAKALQSDFQKAAEQLPFRQISDPVFMQVLRIKEDHYRLVLVDPGWIDPADRKVEVKIQLPGEFKAENILNRQVYPVSNGMFSLEVPAGLFAVVDVKKIF